MEFLPARGSVDGSCFVELLVDGLEAGQEVEHIDARPPPAAEEEQCKHAGMAVLQPLVGFEAEEVQNLVHLARVIFGEHEAEQGTGNNYRSKCRGIEDGLPDSLGLDQVRIHEDREQHGEGNEQDQGPEHVSDAVSDRNPENGILGQLPVIAEADEDIACRLDIEEAHPDRRAHGVYPEDGEAQDERKDKYIRGNFFGVDEFFEHGENSPLSNLRAGTAGPQGKHYL